MQVVHEIAWSDRLFRLVGAAGLVAAAGLISAWLTPRGPVTTFQALVTMASAVLIGMVVGLIMRSHWSMLVAPAVFIGVFELSRLGVAGPTVDAIHLNSVYGAIAFIVGRLFHGALVLAPMMLGAVYGVRGAARLAGEPTPLMGITALVFTALATLALIGFAILMARPAVTPPIIGPAGEPLPGSIAELVTVPIGGQNQALMIRGRNTENPVLLHLAGGPGGTDLGAMRADVGLEQQFVVVTWEQRGTGKSYSALDPAEGLTLAQMVADTIEVTNYLRERFDEEKIYLTGNSWGTILGVLAVQQQPELFHAYVGTGQMVNPRETDIMFYEDTLAWAEQSGNETLAATLRQNGPPPYDTLLHYEPALSHEHDWNVFPNLDGSKEMPSNLFVPENNLMDRFNGMRAFLDTFSILYPQLQEIDFRQDVTSLDVPVYIVIGAYEARGRAVLAREWYELIQAPSKEIITFDQSAHRPSFEEPAVFVSVMTRIRDQTYVSD